jgi:PhnB protein
MARVSTYLNFAGTTEEAFNFYKSVFGTDFIGNISRYGDLPVQEGQPEMPEDLKRLVLNIKLPIVGGHILAGTDTMRGELKQGDAITIALELDTKEQADDLFAKLSDGGVVDTPLQTMPWGDYFGSVADKFGIPWMFNYAAK